MIPANQLDAVQAAAYRKIVEAFKATPDWAAHDFEYLGNKVMDVMEETKKRLAGLDFNVETTLFELARTRLIRLPNTQFVYWPQSGSPPKLKFADGREEYAWSYELVRNLALTNDLYDALAEIEASLFATKDQMVVYWWGDLAIGPWQVLHSSVPDKVCFVLEYCAAHIYDDEVHHEARYEMTNLDPLRVLDPKGLRRGLKLWTDYEEKK